MDLIRFFSNTHFKPVNSFRSGRFLFINLFFILLSFIDSNNCFAQNPKLKEGYHIIKELNDDWLVYENQYQDYVPYIKARHYNYQSFSQYFEIEDYRGYKLFLFPIDESYLFINGIFQKKMNSNQWQEFTIDSLYKAYKSPSKLLITLYSVEPNIEEYKLFVVSETKKKSDTLLGNENIAALKAREFSNFQNFAISFSLFLLGIITFLFNFQNNLLVKFISVKDLFTIGKRTDSLIINRPFDIGNILYVIILSFGISLILLILEYNFISILPKQLISSENPSFLNLSGQFLNLSFLIFIAFLIKYFLISLLGNLYQLEKIINLHFFKNLQSTGIFACFLLLSLILLLIYPPSNIQNHKTTYISIFAAFYFVRLFLLFFIIIKAIPVKNLYLFSYLCIVELIPLFIGIRFAL